MHGKVGYLVEQIALILLGLAIASILYPHIQSIINDSYEQTNFWRAIVVEIQVAWPAFLTAVALIVAMIAILWKHKEPDDMEETRVMLYAICKHLCISEDELNEAREKVGKKKVYEKNK